VGSSLSVSEATLRRAEALRNRQLNQEAPTGQPAGVVEMQHRHMLVGAISYVGSEDYPGPPVAEQVYAAEPVYAQDEELEYGATATQRCPSQRDPSECF
jgi:hypothetical protein